MVWVYQRVTYPKLSQTKANEKPTSRWLYRFRFKTLYQTVKGQEMMFFYKPMIQQCASPVCPGSRRARPSLPRGQRSWFPSHSAALLSTNVTPGSSNSIVPCHRTGCQDQHCHRHEAWPDEVYVTRPLRRRPLLERMMHSVSCLCGSQHRAVTHFIYNKCRSQ